MSNLKLLHTLLKSLPAVLTSIFIVAGVVYAGTLTPPSGSPAAQSYTLSDIYNKLNANTSATAGNHDLSTTTTPAASFRSLTEIYNAIPAALSLSASSVTVPIGLNLAPFSLVTVDSDLVAAKIASTTVLFGITGTLYGDTDASKVLTTATYPGTAVPALQWASISSTMTWANATTWCASSSPWRLPTINELLKAHNEEDTDTVLTSGFSNDIKYWSSSENYLDTSRIYITEVTSGVFYSDDIAKTGSTQFRCVR